MNINRGTHTHTHARKQTQSHSHTHTNTNTNINTNTHTHTQSHTAAGEPCVPTYPGVPQAVDMTLPEASILDRPKSLIMILESSSML